MDEMYFCLAALLGMYVFCLTRYSKIKDFFAGTDSILCSLWAGASIHNAIIHELGWLIFSLVFVGVNLAFLEARKRFMEDGE